MVTWSGAIVPFSPAVDTAWFLNFSHVAEQKLARSHATQQQNLFWVIQTDDGTAGEKVGAPDTIQIEQGKGLLIQIFFS